MRYVFLYVGGKVPESEHKTVASKWRNWQMNEKIGVEVKIGTTVSSSGAEKSALDLRGVSVIEADSLEHAKKIARECPSLPYGMQVEVFEELVSA